MKWRRCFASQRWFFLQAEAGIRGWTVTGVQTCALPISGMGYKLLITEFGDHAVARPNRGRRHAVVNVELGDEKLIAHARHLIEEAAPRSFGFAHDLEIGRASCRERV